MVGLHILTGLAMAGAATAKSLTSVWLPNLAPQNFQATLSGSIITANEDATTASVRCPSRMTNIYCDMYNHMTVTYGPSTLGLIYSSYHDDDIHSTAAIIETMGCNLYKSSAVCVDSFTDLGWPWSEVGTQTWSNLASYTTKDVTISITAGGSTTTTTAEATTSSQPHPGSSTTPLATITTSAPFATPDASSNLSNNTSQSSNSAPKTNSESASSTTSNTNGVSIRHPSMAGIAIASIFIALLRM